MRDPMRKKQKLELTWIGKEKRPKLEPRILLEDPEKSYHAKERVSDNDLFDNKLIFGDNLLALKSLEQDYAGKVKCIYIDPPYNTGSAFEHYDDGVEHSIWLSLIRERLEILKKLLTEDGSIWISIDDNEVHYLKVLCDEIFGRGRFIASNVWQKRYSRENREAIGDVHEYLLVYAINPTIFKNTRNKIPPNEKQLKVYKNPNNDPKGPWRPIPITAQAGHATASQFYEIKDPRGKIHTPPKGRCWGISEKRFNELRKEGRIYFGKDQNSQPNMIRYANEIDGFAPWTWWPNEEVGHTDEAKKEMHSLFGKEKAFDTPKPERLIERVLQIATNPGDLVLDSFAGSGTTGAVAHKMGRRWLMIELHDHCDTHITPRLRQVIDGSDQGGTSKAINWKGGGGFRYYRLAPSMLKKDKWGNWVINDGFNATMLAETMCQMMGFTYAPSKEHYWEHGHSSESDFIYVTTQTLDQMQLAAICEAVGENRTLLVCCAAFRAKAEEYPSLTLKKIPDSVLKKCEWGKDAYSLNVQNLPAAIEAETKTDLFEEEV